MISSNCTLASAATSYSASSDAAGSPSRPHWRHSSPKFLPTQGIFFTSPLMCTRAISSICSRADLNAFRLTYIHFRGSSARSSCSLAWASIVGHGTVRVPSGPSVAAASKAFFFSASYSTPISFLMATSESGAPSVDTPAPMTSSRGCACLLQHTII